LLVDAVNITHGSGRARIALLHRLLLLSWLLLLLLLHLNSSALLILNATGLQDEV
jgi:hypothetical protein